MTTGQRMKERRKQIGLSAETVASRLGVSPATIYRYENGGIDKVPGDILAPIAEILQTSPAYLMGWEYEENEISPEMLALMEQLSSDHASGRDEARSAMIKTHGTESGVHTLRLVDDKSVFMYYHAFDDIRSASAASDLMSALEKLSPADAEHLKLLVEAYTAADSRTRQMVDLALDPYLSQDTKDWEGTLAPDSRKGTMPNAEEPAIVRNSLRSKRTK